MTSFVLVHGAWHGGWCWAQLADHLRRMGHDVHAPTLTGLGERRHLASPDITPDTHVLDVTSLIEMNDLQDIVLVGHSYGGLIVTGVASRMPDRLAALVYLDAVVPQVSGISAMAQRNPERLAAFRAQLSSGGFMVEPDRFDAWSDDPQVQAWLRTKCSPHPIRCLTEGVTLTGREAEVARRHYILAARNRPSMFWHEYEQVKDRDGWTTETMPTMHDAMIESPADLADRLQVVAASAARSNSDQIQAADARGVMFDQVNVAISEDFFRNLSPEVRRQLDGVDARASSS